MVNLIIVSTIKHEVKLGYFDTGGRRGSPYVLPDDEEATFTHTGDTQRSHVQRSQVQRTKRPERETQAQESPAESKTTQLVSNSTHESVQICIHNVSICYVDTINDISIAKSNCKCCTTLLYLQDETVANKDVEMYLTIPYKDASSQNNLNRNVRLIRL